MRRPLHTDEKIAIDDYDEHLFYQTAPNNRHKQAIVFYVEMGTSIKNIQFK